MIRGGDISGGQISRELPCVSVAKSNEYCRTVTRTGDVVIALVGYPGEAAKIPEWLSGANISRAVGLLRTGDKICADYLVQYLNSETGRAETLKPSAGSAQIVVNLRALNNLQLPVAPYAEQRDIVRVLSDVDAWIAGAEAVVAKQRALRAATMDALLTPRTRLPGFRAEWRRVAIGEHITIRDEKVSTLRLDAAQFSVDLEQIVGAQGRLSSFVDARAQDTTRYLFQPGDVLFGRLRAYLEKYWVADRTGVCSTEIWPLIPLTAQIKSAYLGQLVRTPRFLEAASTAYGTHMPRADWDVIAALEFDVPVERAEQTAIAAVLTDIDAAIETAETVAGKARALKSALMDELLTGRTRLLPPQAKAA